MANREIICNFNFEGTKEIFKAMQGSGFESMKDSLILPAAIEIAKFLAVDVKPDGREAFKRIYFVTIDGKKYYSSSPSMIDVLVDYVSLDPESHTPIKCTISLKPSRNYPGSNYTWCEIE